MIGRLLDNMPLRRYFLLFASRIPASHFPLAAAGLPYKLATPPAKKRTFYYLFACRDMIGIIRHTIASTPVHTSTDETLKKSTHFTGDIADYMDDDNTPFARCHFAMMPPPRRAGLLAAKL